VAHLLGHVDHGGRKRDRVSIDDEVLGADAEHGWALRQACGDETRRRPYRMRTEWQASCIAVDHERPVADRSREEVHRGAPDE
jgi:hypothetical protein